MAHPLNRGLEIAKIPALGDGGSSSPPGLWCWCPAERAEASVGVSKWDWTRTTGFLKGLLAIHLKKEKHTPNNFQTKGIHSKPAGPSFKESKQSKNIPSPASAKGHLLLSRSRRISSPVSKPVGFSIITHGRLGTFSSPGESTALMQVGSRGHVHVQLTFPRP